MRGRIILMTALGVLASVATLVAVVSYYQRPTTLTVAVSSLDSDDAGLMNAAATLLKKRRHALRLKIVAVNGVAAASAALDAGDVDLAVVRPDVAMPANGGTVVITHKDAAVLIAPGGSKVTKLENLTGKRVGMLSSRPGDARILEAALQQLEISTTQVTFAPLALKDVKAALAAKTVDAVFSVGPVTGGLVPDTVAAVAGAARKPPVFLPVAEAAAIAQRTASYESISVVRGAFGGTAPRPPEEFDTIGVTYRLVADTRLAQGDVASLTRFLLSERAALAEVAPSARHMVAPPTDKGAPLPAHPGTAAYIDDEEETFLDQYSDFIYLGAMMIGVVTSGLTAIVARFGASGSARVENLLAQLLAMLRQVRVAATAGGLDAVEEEVDGVVATALDERCLRTLDERRVAALTMAVDQVRSAIRDRRRDLRHATLTPANDRLPLDFVPEGGLASPIDKASLDA